MRRFLMLSIVFSITLVGCESKQAEDRQTTGPVQPLNTQYNKDCIAPAFGGKGCRVLFQRRETQGSNAAGGSCPQSEVCSRASKGNGS